MTQTLSRFTLRLFCVMALICALLLSCGLTAFAAEEGSTDLPATAPPPATEEPSPLPEATPVELFPADVQTVITDDGRQIIKTYILTDGESPGDIPRDTFTRDGWRYTLTDITQRKTSVTDTRPHVETVEINSDSNDLNAIIEQLSPTLEYQSEDGYCGLLALDLASVKCEAAGYKTSSYTVSATREYPHLSDSDTSLIPKTITENGRTLELDGVSWETQNYTTVDYDAIPDSYRAVATYTATASSKKVTGYITTAEYTGEIGKTSADDTVYTVYFAGIEVNPAPKPTEPTTEPTSPTPVEDNNTASLLPLIIAAIIAALIGGAAVFFFLRHNVKIYNIREDGGRVLVAKVRISAKNPTIDLTPLDGRSENRRFNLEIDKLAAKSLNGKTIEVIFGPAKLIHTIAYEGNPYKIEADFHSAIIKAIY